MSLPTIQPAPTQSQEKCCGCGGCESGFVHSIESMGMVDGPGIRTVVFLSGCPLRCKYCHNIDITVPDSGEELSAEELVERLVKNKSYYDRSGGGVTFSGGEPLFQTCFLKKSLQLCHEAGIHTVVDTSLFSAPENVEKILPYVDHFLVSIKQLDAQEHKKLTGVTNEVILKNLQMIVDAEKPIWIRYVLLPGITDTDEYLERLSVLLEDVGPEEIEILPYHKAGTEKWKKIGLQYDFDTVKEPTDSEVARVQEFFESKDFSVLCHDCTQVGGYEHS